MRHTIFRVLVLLLLTGIVLELSEVVALLTRIAEAFSA